MDRRAVIFVVIGIVLGSFTMGILKQAQLKREADVSLKAVETLTDTTSTYAEGYNKLNHFNGEILILAVAYKQAKDPAAKEQAADALATKIIEFNSNLTK